MTPADGIVLALVVVAVIILVVMLIRNRRKKEGATSGSSVCDSQKLTSLGQDVCRKIKDCGCDMSQSEPSTGCKACIIKTALSKDNLTQLGRALSTEPLFDDDAIAEVSQGWADMINSVDLPSVLDSATQCVSQCGADEACLTSCIGPISVDFNE